MSMDIVTGPPSQPSSGRCLLALYEGFLAGSRRMSLASNPYHSHDPKYTAWWNGHQLHMHDSHAPPIKRAHCKAIV
jgi:hypothetical protein